MRKTFNWILFAIVIGLLATSIGGNAFLYQRELDRRAQLETVIKEKEALTVQVAGLNKDLGIYIEELGKTRSELKIAQLALDDAVISSPSVTEAIKHGFHSVKEKIRSWF